MRTGVAAAHRSFRMRRGHPRHHNPMYTRRAWYHRDQWKACSGAGNSRFRTSAAKVVAACDSTPARSA